MAPKSLPPAAKQAMILNYFRQSLTAHSLKDLEKALPSVASINGMQVKDYLQALSDDNKIRVEKIGSGNWYWSFASEEKKTLQDEHDKVEAEHTKVVATVNEVKAKIEEAETAREEGEDGADRAELLKSKIQLELEVEALQKELQGHSSNDPVAVEKKRARVETLKAEVERSTEHIQSIEGWLKEQMVGNTETLVLMMLDIYGDQFDAENLCLTEL